MRIENIKKMRTAGLGGSLDSCLITSGPPKNIANDPLVKRGKEPQKNLKRIKTIRIFERKLGKP